MSAAAPLRLVGPASDSDPVTDFAATFTVARTRREYARVLSQLFRETGATAPADLTIATLRRWCAADGLANNTIRQRVTVVTSFLRWCHENGIPAPPVDCLRPLRLIGVMRCLFGR
jgi:hypothetical protein